MKASPTVWTADTLTAFITDPAKAIPGNKMDYPGNDAATAKAIADYLMTLKSAEPAGVFEFRVRFPLRP